MFGSEISVASERFGEYLWVNKGPRDIFESTRRSEISEEFRDIFRLTRDSDVTLGLGQKGGQRYLWVKKVFRKIFG